MYLSIHQNNYEGNGIQIGNLMKFQNRWYRAPELLVGDPAYGKEVTKMFNIEKQIVSTFHISNFFIYHHFFAKIEIM